MEKVIGFSIVVQYHTLLSYEMKLTMKKLTLLLLFNLITIYGIRSQNWVDELDSVMTIVETDELFHGQLLIAEKGKILISKAYGKNQKGDLIVMETPLSIASVTKSFTAVAILILQERGMLTLDDQLIKYFPQLPYAGITIRNLLNMTSGLPRFFPTFISNGDTTEQLSNKEVIELMAQYKPKASDPPGSTFFYNNDNYLLLASIIEVVSGETYPDFIRKNIFGPLKMENSYVKRFKKLNQDQINSSNFLATYGEGEIYSTAQDLFLFDQALYTNQLLSKDLVRTMYESTTLNDGSVSNYGFGWRVSDYENKTEVYHVGDGENIRASIQRFIDDKNTFIYIHNFSGKEWKQVYGMIRNIWEGKHYEIPARRTVYKIDPNKLNKYVGQYLTENFGLLHITAENNRLYLRPDPIPEKEALIPSSDTTFYFKDQGVEWEFFFDKKGKVIGFGIKGRPDLMGAKQ